MQINAVNSVNFKNSYDKYDEPVVLKGKVVDFDEPDFADSFDKAAFDAAKIEAEKKAMQNVHPSTIVVGALTLAACYKAGQKVAGYAVNAGIKAYEVLAHAGVKVVDSATNALNKKTDKIKKIDSQRLHEGIDKQVNKLRSNEIDDKMMTSVRKFTKDITSSDEQAQKAVDFVQGPLGIKNKKDILKGAIATAIGWRAADRSSDIAEQAADAHDIASALNLVLE